MNEQLKELALEAEDYAFDETSKLEDEVETVFSNRLFFKSFKEKFAELIVRECAKRVDYWESRQGEHTDDILKHFGVEE